LPISIPLLTHNVLGRRITGLHPQAWQPAIDRLIAELGLLPSVVTLSLSGNILDSGSFGSNCYRRMMENLVNLKELQLDYQFGYYLPYLGDKVLPSGLTKISTEGNLIIPEMKKWLTKISTEGNLIIPEMKKWLQANTMTLETLILPVSKSS
jgi:hypothetical protein